jgi:hypothetical protein
MKTKFTILVALLTWAVVAQAQDIETVFRGSGQGVSVGGYGAMSNKFTKIRGEYANFVEVYGGVYLNHRVLIGIGGGATTNNLPVPAKYSTIPDAKLSYQYGQCGLVTEYVIGSNRSVHLVAHLFTGAGFTLQYDRYHDWSDDYFDDFDKEKRDENWFVVAEPAIQVEINLFRWARLSPGISYRTTFGSEGRGLDDSDLSNISYNATLKFGRF